MKDKISQESAFISIEKVMLGPERKSFVMSEKEKKITAYHEAGHAIVANILPEADPVHKVSIISRLFIIFGLISLSSANAGFINNKNIPKINVIFIVGIIFLLLFIFRFLVICYPNGSSLPAIRKYA